MGKRNTKQPHYDEQWLKKPPIQPSVTVTPLLPITAAPNPTVVAHINAPSVCAHCYYYCFS